MDALEKSLDMPLGRRTGRGLLTGSMTEDPRRGVSRKVPGVRVDPGRSDARAGDR